MAKQHSKAVNQYRKVLGVMGVLHLGLAAWVTFSPGMLIRVINFFGRLFSAKMAAPNLWRIPADQIWHFVFVGAPKVEEGQMFAFFPDHSLFISMAVAYLVFLGVVGVMVYFAPRTAEPYVPVALLGKTFVALFGLGSYFLVYGYFVNLLLPIIDLPLVIVALVFWLRARGEINDDGGQVTTTE